MKSGGMMKNDNRNDRRTSGPAKGTGKTKATGKANATGKTKVTAGKEKRTTVGQGREKTTVKNKSGICPVADKCGGCSWINQPYAEQLKKKEKQENLMMAGTVAFSIVAAVAIFMILPYFLSTLMKPVIPSYHLRTVIEGVVRIGIFIVYILLISRMEDIQRTFMYHGAEHKCINCIEHGLPLTVENVRKSSRQHKRCGTSFLFFVLAISIILLLLIRVESPLMRVVVRIALLPVIAGISYEVLKLAGNSENALVNLLSKPGMAIQMMTTSEPDDDMIEVAIQAVEAVFDWRAYERENFHTS